MFWPFPGRPEDVERCTLILLKQSLAAGRQLLPFERRELAALVTEKLAMIRRAPTGIYTRARDLWIAMDYALRRRQGLASKAATGEIARDWLVQAKVVEKACARYLRLARRAIDEYAAGLGDAAAAADELRVRTDRSRERILASQPSRKPRRAASARRRAGSQDGQALQNRRNFVG